MCLEQLCQSTQGSFGWELNYLYNLRQVLQPFLGILDLDLTKEQVHVCEILLFKLYCQRHLRHDEAKIARPLLMALTCSLLQNHQVEISSNRDEDISLL